MALRMTGMMSGLDTESIIQELVAVRRTKVDKQKKAQTSLNWKQEAWKGLNSKLRSLQQKYLANMKFSDAYTKKTTKVSNSSAVSVITGANAVNGVQSLKIESLAKNGYLTGATVESNSGGKLTALSKLSDMKGFIGGDGVINIKTGDKDIDVAVNDNTTISDVLTQLKNAGLNASFDEKWQRISISSKESGTKNDFSITASGSVGASALEALGIQTDITKDKATMAEYEKFAKYVVKDGLGQIDKAATLANMQEMIDKDVESRKNSYLNQYKSLKDSMKAAQDKIDEINEKYKDDPLKSVEEYANERDKTNKAIKEKQEEIEKITDPDQKKAAQEELDKLVKEADALTEKLSDAQAVKKQQDNLAQYGDELAKVESYINVTDNGDGTYSATATGKLQGEVEDRYFDKASYAAGVIENGIAINPDRAATKIDGQDAVIYLNGARYEKNDNTFEINGLTFTALATTAENEEITVTTEQDTDGIYDMIKNFLKEYNAVLNEMDKLYNAESAKGYEPLTDEEKASMSEKDIEKWEQKVKDSILRKDENISSVSTAMSGIMAGGIDINGKTMYLFDFGIEPLGYFEAADNERHAYHIAGDPDDAATMNKEDKLKTMISNDPDTVISFFTKLSRNLDTKMTELSKSVNGYRSYGSFYDDKKMKSDYDDYTSKIKEMEAKLTEYEDKWYAKFSKMETALAKMQSNASAVTSLLGG